jgi:hypothetical protein
MLQWLLNLIYREMMRKDDRVSRGLLGFMGTTALVWLTVHGTRGWMGAIR